MGRPSFAFGRVIQTFVIVFGLVMGLGLASSAYAQCGPGAGPCCEANGTPGCEDVACCECICNCDAFCCNNSWDSLCGGMGLGGTNCGASNPEGPCTNECSFCLDAPPPVCPECVGDLTNSGTVGVGDLLELLGCWGPVTEGCECADITDSGSVGVGDLLELLGNWGPCPEPICGPGAGDCCDPAGNGTPGCENVECCDLICGQDAFCCDVEWDSICATQAIAQCAVCAPGPCPPGATGDCCAPNATPGCDDPECCNCVCNQDPFCCDVEWDGLCSGAASGVCADSCDCPDICGPGAGDCCIVNGTPGCDDVGCCELICAQDPFCCDVTWDGLCAGAALTQCDVCQDFGACCFADGSCLDLFPVDCNAMGGTFQGIGTDCDTAFCPEICGPGAGDCCIVNGSPGCEDPDCCNMICAADPFCCDVTWDGLCAGAALNQCAVCQDFGACCFADGSCLDLFPVDCNAMGGTFQGIGTDCTTAFCPEICGPGAGDCCIVNGTPGCEDPECCNQICAFDPFCCDVTWDGICANSALNQCQVCQEPGACCFADGSCLDGISAIDCGLAGGTFQGIGLTCDQVFCPEICGPGAGDCCIVNGSPGCENGECCDCVCGQDPFCCDVTWDGLCAGRAGGVCNSVCECIEECDPGEVPPNDLCFDADWAPMPLGPGDSHTFEGSNLCATHDCGIFGGAGQGNVWIAFELLEDASLSLSYCGSVNTEGGPFGNVWLNLALGCPCTGFTAAGSFAASCPDGNFEIDYISMAAGVYYYPVMLDHVFGSAGDYQITVTVGAPLACDCITAVGIGCPENPDCEACVCGQDPFCCDVAWDGLCVGRAMGVCSWACCDE